MLIAIEGCDGAGKSTVAAELAKRLNGSVISFPNDAGVTGPMIRAYLRKEWSIARSLSELKLAKGWPKGVEHSSALAFQVLQITNRMEVMDQLQVATTRKPDIVLARYWQSAWVYGQLDGLDPDWLRGLRQTMAQPTLNILLDLDPIVALKRRADRDGKLPPERYEGKLEFTAKVADLYRTLWAQERKDYWFVVDANQAFEKVCGDCWKLIH